MLVFSILFCFAQPVEQDASPVVAPRAMAMPSEVTDARAVLAAALTESAIAFEAEGNVDRRAEIAPAGDYNDPNTVQIKIIPITNPAPPAQFVVRGVIFADVFFLDLTPLVTPDQHKPYSWAHRSTYSAGPDAPATVVAHDAKTASTYAGRIPQNVRSRDLYSPADILSVAFAQVGEAWVPFVLRNDEMPLAVAKQFIRTSISHIVDGDLTIVEERWVCSLMKQQGKPLELKRALTYDRSVGFLPIGVKVWLRDLPIYAARLHWAPSRSSRTLLFRGHEVVKLEADAFYFDDSMATHLGRQFVYEMKDVRSLGADEARRAARISIPDTYQVALFDAGGRRKTSDKPQPGTLGTIPLREGIEGGTAVGLIGVAVPVLALALVVLALLLRRRLQAQKS